MTKYKPILKHEKEFFNKCYETVADPNKTQRENIQTAFNFMGNAIRMMYDDNIHSNEAQLKAVASKILIDDMNGKLLHIFIKDAALLEFLKNTEIRNTDIVDDYIKENSNWLDSDVKRYPVNYYSLAIHTEKEGIAITYLRGIKESTKNTLISVYDETQAYQFDLTTTDLPENCRLAINLIYYMKAYPEKVLSGVPDDMVKNDKKKYAPGKSVSIGIAEEIIEKTSIVDGRIISPHFRSGFFRHYTDDRYINMKGKVQFIASTMVKGKAKTVVA